MNTFDETSETNSRAYTPEEVQDEFFSGITFLIPYWVNTTHYEYKNKPLTDRLAGAMHSFYVTLAGNAGFGAGVDMMAYSTEEAADAKVAAGLNFFPAGKDDAVDINDGGLQYHSADQPVEAPLQEAGVRREWTAEEILTMFLKRVNEILTDWNARTGISDIEKGAGMMRDIFVLCDGNDPKFEARIDFVASPHPDDKAYYIENDENYYEEKTLISTPGNSLTQAWDEWWARTNK